MVTGDLAVTAGNVPGLASYKDAVAVVLVSEQAVDMDGSVASGQRLRRPKATGRENGVTLSMNGDTPEVGVR